MKKNQIVEVHEFNLIEGISDEALVKAIRKAKTQFFRKQPGFIRCEILKSGENWINVSYWRTTQEAKDALSLFLQHSSCFPFVQMVSPSTERRLYMKAVLSCSAPFAP